MLKKLLPPLFLACCYLAQSQTVFTPAPTKPVDLDNYLTLLEDDLNTNMKNLPKGQRHIFKKFFAHRYEYLSNSLENGHFLFSEDLSTYLQNILEEICRANPELPCERFRLFVGRYGSPNASSLGDGFFVFNLGLLTKLENESQIAFILCHEIAHSELKHADHTLKNHSETIGSKKTQRDLRRSARMGMDDKVSMLREIVYETRRLSREHESEADAFGLSLMCNTRFDASQALRTMEILDSIDLFIFNDVFDLKTIFHSNDYAFKDRWLATQTTMDFSPAAIEESTKFQRDSMRTHPYCTERRNLLAKALANCNHGNQSHLQEKKLLDDLLRSMDFELAEGYHSFQQIDECLFHTLTLLQSYPDSPYLHGKVGHCLYAAHRAMLEHTFHTAVSQPAPHQAPGFHQLVTFLHNLRTKEIQKIAYHYLKDREEKYADNEEFLFALAMTANINDLTAEFSAWKAKYEDLFPHGRYRSLLSD